MLFLPTYSPTFNTIEMAVSKLKAHFRRIGAWTYDTLIRALGDICGLFDPEECGTSSTPQDTRLVKRKLL